MRTDERGETVAIPVGAVKLVGELVIPSDPRGLVLFAHGSGSGRRSPRNRFVAEELRLRGLGTLLFDLLTAGEEKRDAIDAQLRFDIPLLAKRLGGATDWVKQNEATAALTIGYFGASTGAAAALIAAARHPDEIAAVVSRGGRPDLAEGLLQRVRAPTLLIVGGADTTVLALNQRALKDIAAPKELAVVPDATHLFEQPGALEEVARLAAEWFARYFEGHPSQARAEPSNT